MPFFVLSDSDKQRIRQEIFAVHESVTAISFREDRIVIQLAPGEQDQKILKEIEGIPVQYSFAVDFHLSSPIPPPTSSCRTCGQITIRPGVSIGHYRNVGGTLSAVVYDLGTLEWRFLSCMHVFAPPIDTDFQYSYTDPVTGVDHIVLKRFFPKVGDPIYQPGYLDAGSNPAWQKRTVATLDRWVNNIVRIGKAYQQPTPDNNVDCALGKPVPRDQLVQVGVTGGLSRLLIDANVFPTGITEAKVGMDVIGVGKTTGIMTGKILSTDWSGTSRYGIDKDGNSIDMNYYDMIETTPMLRSSDSGTIILEKESLNAVGILFAGPLDPVTGDPVFHSLASKMTNVQKALGIRIVRTEIDTVISVLGRTVDAGEILAGTASGALLGLILPK